MGLSFILGDNLKKTVKEKFKEFNNINEIEQYRQKSLLVDRQNAVKLRK